MPNQQSPRGESSGLTPAQLEQLRASLQHARAETLALLQGEEATARSTDDDSRQEPMDAAELSREQGDAVLLSERARARLREIDRALADMDSGRYGLSASTGDPIPFERLRAIPWTRVNADES